VATWKFKLIPLLQWIFEDPERPGHRIAPLDELKYVKSKADVNSEAQRRAQDYLRSAGMDHAAEPVASYVNKCPSSTEYLRQ